MNVSFGEWIGAALIVVAGVAIVEQYDSRMALILAVLILLAAFLRYPTAASEIARMIGIRPQLPPNERT